MAEKVELISGRPLIKMLLYMKNIILDNLLLITECF